MHVCVYTCICLWECCVWFISQMSDSGGLTWHTTTSGWFFGENTCWANTSSWWLAVLFCVTPLVYIYMALYPFVTSRCQNVQPYNISTSVEWQREMWMCWFSLGCCVRFSMIGVKMQTVWRNSVFAYITIIRKIYIYILRQKLRPPLFLNNLETHIFDSENLTVEKIHHTHTKQKFSKRNFLNYLISK